MFSQNLVNNPSFEQGMCPDNYSQITSRARFWKGFSSDYYKSCPRDEKYLTKKMSTPYNINGFQKARTGIAYAGLVSPFELLQTKLKQPLEKDSIYQVEFYTNLSENSSYAIWDLGIYFSSKGFDFDWGSNIYDTIKPQIRNQENRYLRDTVNWMKISGLYKASGYENYLTISSFSRNYGNKISSSLTINDSIKRNRYYYIDDVSVIKFSVNYKYTFNYINDEYKLQNNVFSQLDLIADLLNKNNRINIIITGYTDNIGTKKNNLILSIKRAKMIADYLIKKGVDQNKIEFYGEGSSNPVSLNNTELGRKRNRRVEIILKTDKPNTQ